MGFKMKGFSPFTSRDKIVDFFQFGEHGLWGKEYQKKKQEQVKKGKYRTLKSIEIADRRKAEEKLLESRKKIISHKDYNTKDTPGGKRDKDYITISATEGGLKDRKLTRVLKSDYDINKDYQESRQNYLDSKTTESDVDRVRKEEFEETKKFIKKHMK